MSIVHYKTKKKNADEPEPIDLCVFALVNKEIRVTEIKHSGTQKVFETLASVTVDGMPTDMDIEQHKVTNKIIIVVAMQGISSKLLSKHQDVDPNDANNKAYITVI